MDKDYEIDRRTRRRKTFSTKKKAEKMPQTKSKSKSKPIPKSTSMSMSKSMSNRNIKLRPQPTFSMLYEIQDKTSSSEANKFQIWESDTEWFGFGGVRFGYGGD